jgi:hypothetical protein
VNSVSLTTVTLNQEIHGFLAAAVFILLAVQGYLQTSPLVAGRVYLQLFIAVLPFIIGIVKIFGGSTSDGVLTPSQAKGFYYLAVILTVAMGTLSGITSDPLFLLIGGLLAAIAAGITAFLGTQPSATSGTGATPAATPHL